MNFKEEIVIEAGKNWFAESVRELIRYKDLLYFMVIRGIKAKYAQSVLGISWAIVQPLFTTVVFTIIFGNLVQVSSDGMPYILFSFSGMVIWNYFSNTLTEASGSVVGNASMITKVYFPRIILPLSAAFSKLLDFLIGLAVLVGFLVYFKVLPSLNILWLPVVVLVMLLFSLGIGSFLSALAVQYRDVKHALSFLVQILMYACPVVYPASVIPEEYRTLYALNPMVGVIEGFRAAFIPTVEFSYQYFAIGSAMSVLVFIGGTAYFNKFERKFADVA